MREAKDPPIRQAVVPRRMYAGSSVRVQTPRVLDANLLYAAQLVLRAVFRIGVLRGADVQRAPVLPAQRAREAALRELDAVRHLPALEDADALG